MLYFIVIVANAILHELYPVFVLQYQKKKPMQKKRVNSTLPLHFDLYYLSK